MNAACPNCKSEDWKMLPAVVEQGEHKSTSFTTGLFSFGVVPFLASTSGTSKTSLAKRASMPTKRTIYNWYFLIGLLLFGFSINAFKQSIQVGGYFLLIIGCIVMAYWLYCWQLADNAYSKVMEQWKQTKACMRCGTFF